MKSIRIYHPEQFEVNQSIQLEKSASNHLVRVLRLKNEQALTVFNGLGNEYLATLEITGKKATAHIQSFIKTHNESPLNIHLLQGISKGDRMDFVIQKAVELGANKITPVICERTVVNLKGERLQKKLQHWKSIAISACEQSGRNVLPEITMAISLDKIIASNTTAHRLVLDPLSEINIKSQTPTNKEVQILIGPEGGLSSNEIEKAKENQFTGIQLGPRILRTETAAIAAITAAQLLWGDY